MSWKCGVTLLHILLLENTGIQPTISLAPRGSVEERTVQSNSRHLRYEKSRMYPTYVKIPLVPRQWSLAIVRKELCTRRFMYIQYPYDCREIGLSEIFFRDHHLKHIDWTQFRIEEAQIFDKVQQKGFIKLYIRSWNSGCAPGSCRLQIVQRILDYSCTELVLDWSKFLQGLLQNSVFF